MLLVKTVQYARRQWREMATSTQTQIEALGENKRSNTSNAADNLRAYRLSKESLESVQQAFVFPKGTTDEVFAPDGKTPSGVKFTIHWENSGSMPTEDMTLHTNIQWWATKMPDDFSFTDIWDPGMTHKDRQIYLAPKASLDSNPRILPVSVLADIANGRVQYFLFGWARYHDVFSNTKQHITRYCYQILVKPQSRDESRMSLQAFLLACERNNCSDDQCQVQ